MNLELNLDWEHMITNKLNSKRSSLKIKKLKRLSVRSLEKARMTSKKELKQNLFLETFKVGI